MRLMGIAGMYAMSLAVGIAADVSGWAGGALGCAAVLLGYLAGCAVDALQRSAEAHEQMARLATVPYLLAAGEIELADLVAVRVPDAPPEDLGGGS